MKDYFYYAFMLANHLFYSLEISICLHGNIIGITSNGCTITPIPYRGMFYVIAIFIKL